jgi:hypothetical protein
MSREERARARRLMQVRLDKRKGCIPRLKSECGKARCAGRPVFVKPYSVVSGKYAGANRGQYCRGSRSRA